MKTTVGALLIIGCGTWLAGCKPGDSVSPRGSGPPNAAGETVVLATIPAMRDPAATAPLPGGGLHSAATAAPQFFFSGRGGGVAFVVERDDGFQVVHNGSVGKRYSAVGEIALSPDGKRCAYGALADGKWRMVVDGKEGRGFSAVRAPVFSPDGIHLAYQAMAGDRWHLVVDATVNAGTRTRYLEHDFGAGSSRIAFIESADGGEWGRLVVSDLAFSKQTVVDSSAFGLLLNADKSRLASLSIGGGRQRMVTCSLERPDVVRRGAEYDYVFRPAFGPDGVSLAYVGWRGDLQMMVMDDREAPSSAGELVEVPVVRPARPAVGALLKSGASVQFHEFFGDEAKAEAAYEEAEALVYSPDGRSHAYAARRGDRWFVVVNGKEGRPLDRVVSPSFSPDGARLVYRARRDGRRFVVVADGEGRTVREHPPYDQVFPVVIAADGRSIGYGVKDGQQLAWKVEPP